MDVHDFGGKGSGVVGGGEPLPQEAQAGDDVVDTVRGKGLGIGWQPVQQEAAVAGGEGRHAAAALGGWQENGCPRVRSRSNRATPTSGYR
jgi:hypothetical protein